MFEQLRQTSAPFSNHSVDIGLKLNISKCEIIARNPVTIHDSSILSKFVKVTKDEITLLGAPVVRGPAQDAALTHEIDELKKALKRLSMIH